jgi:hypothetical protein
VEEGRTTSGKKVRKGLRKGESLSFILKAGPGHRRVKERFQRTRRSTPAEIWRSI